MWFVCFGEQTFQSCVNGCEAAVVTDLENGVAALRLFVDELRVGDRGRERFFAEDVFAGFDGGECEWNVTRVRRRDEYCIRTFDDFVRR